MISLGIFILCVLAILHSYLFFPWILNVLSKGKLQNLNCFESNKDELPFISIILAAYNEERVIEEKILTMMNSGYPQEKIEFLIGSDASTDKTNQIIEKYQGEYPQIKLTHFGGRTGKAGICNQLVKIAKHPILIMTDANVFLKKDCLFHLVKHFKNPEIGMVGGNILNERIKADGISFQEKTYLSRENKIKYQEGIIWGSMIGAFGGIYAIRKELHVPVPPKFFMDDFYISMYVLQENYHSINELEAVCDEDVSNKITEEFRRKIRISIGNFQNLSTYYPLLFRGNGMAFCFLSHKVLRWITPILLIITLICSAVASMQFPLFQYLFIGQLIGILIPLLDEMLKHGGIHNRYIRFLSHFYLMNLALLIGLYRFLKGVQTNIWKPTERFQ